MADLTDYVAGLLRGAPGPATLSARLAALERRLAEPSTAGGGDSIAQVITSLSQIPTRRHSELQNLTAPADDHTQYALLAGRSGGQELIGGTEAANTLKLRGNSISASDEVLWHFLLKGPKLETENIKLIGTKSLGGLSNLVLEGGSLEIGLEELVLGNRLGGLSQRKVNGTVNDSAILEEVPFDCAYGVIPEATGVLTGMHPLSEHQLVLLTNIGAETLTIEHESAGSLTTNRFHFASGKSVKLEVGQAIVLWHTEGTSGLTLKRWRDLGGASFWLAPKHAAITNPGEELKAVREKLEEVIAVLKERALTA